MENHTYRLAEYKIIEQDAISLRWETHFGVGALKEGSCFRKGKILFIGPPENDRPGLLKLEFIDHLEKLPDWTKTKYYTTSLNLYHCATNKKVTMTQMQSWAIKCDPQKKDKTKQNNYEQPHDFFTKKDSEYPVFRLNQYEIIKKGDGKILWNLYRNPNNIKSGDCVIMEDILFLKSSQNNPSKDFKEHFSTNFKNLPKWDQTKYYCLKFSLHECETISKDYILKRTTSDNTKTVRGDDDKEQYKNETKVNHNSSKLGLSDPEVRSAKSQLPFKSTPSQREETYSSALNGIDSNSPSSLDVPHASGPKNWFVRAFILIFFTIALFITFLINYSMTYNEKSYYHKDGYHSSHKIRH